MKRLTITLDPSNNWNTDMWHKKFDANMPRESFKLTLDAVTTLFHSLLHDIPCGVPAQMEGLADVLNETVQRSSLKEATQKSNRMVAFVQMLASGLHVDIQFCNGKKVDCKMYIAFEWSTRQLFCSRFSK